MQHAVLAHSPHMQSVAGERPSGPVRSMSQVERIRPNMEAQPLERGGEGCQVPPPRPVLGGPQLGSPTLSKGTSDRDASRLVHEVSVHGH